MLYRWSRTFLSISLLLFDSTNLNAVQNYKLHKMKRASFEFGVLEVYVKIFYSCFELALWMESMLGWPIHTEKEKLQIFMDDHAYLVCWCYCCISLLHLDDIDSSICWTSSVHPLGLNTYWHELVESAALLKITNRTWQNIALQYTFWRPRHCC